MAICAPLWKGPCANVVCGDWLGSHSTRYFHEETGLRIGLHAVQRVRVKRRRSLGAREYSERVSYRSGVNRARSNFGVRLEATAR